MGGTLRQRGHRQVDHTADLALELWAPDEPSLLVEGARAVIAEMTGGGPVRANATRPVALQALDAEDRLVQWLNEVIWMATRDGFLTADATLTLTGGHLRGSVHGEADAASRIQTELKSATYHGLRIRKRNDLYHATVVIDV
ncbi:MAG: archease [Myxococcota bacterium]